VARLVPHGSSTYIINENAVVVQNVAEHGMNVVYQNVSAFIIEGIHVLMQVVERLRHVKQRNGHVGTLGEPAGLFGVFGGDGEGHGLLFKGVVSIWYMPLSGLVLTDNRVALTVIGSRPHDRSINSRSGFDDMVKVSSRLLTFSLNALASSLWAIAHLLPSVWCWQNTTPSPAFTPSSRTRSLLSVMRSLPMLTQHMPPGSTLSLLCIIQLMSNSLFVLDQLDEVIHPLLGLFGGADELALHCRAGDARQREERTLCAAHGFHVLHQLSEPGV
jgi:hypothetical protein